MMRLIAGLLATCGILQAAAAVREFIFTSAPFASSHVSNVVELRNGEFLACWFGGSVEGRPDAAIWESRLSQEKWSAPGELAQAGDRVLQPPTGRTPLNLAFSEDGDLRTTYTWKRERIRYVRFPLADIPR